MRNPEANSPVTNVLLFLIMTLIFVAGLIITCSCSLTSLSPDRILEDVILKEWKIAQKNLECLGFPASRVEPTSFRWVRHMGTFKCGNVQRANGCFYTGTRTINWNAKTPQVIRHEGGHAILWTLNRRPLWKCYEHGAPEGQEQESGKEWCPIEILYAWECKTEGS